jgi:hypothetical protein
MGESSRSGRGRERRAWCVINAAICVNSLAAAKMVRQELSENLQEFSEEQPMVWPAVFRMGNLMATFRMDRRRPISQLPAEALTSATCSILSNGAFEPYCFKGV